MEKTYDTGYQLALIDIAKHGVLHAADKAEVLTGQFAVGYADALSGK